MSTSSTGSRKLRSSAREVVLVLGGIAVIPLGIWAVNEWPAEYIDPGPPLTSYDCSEPRPTFEEDVAAWRDWGRACTAVPDMDDKYWEERYGGRGYEPGPGLPDCPAGVRTC